MVIGAVAPRHLAGIGRFVPPFVLETHRKGADIVFIQPRHQRDDAAGINPARQKRPERHVGNHPHPNRFLQTRDQLLGNLVLGCRTTIGELQLPIGARFGQLLAALDLQAMARHQLADAAVDRARIGNIAEGEKLLDRLRVEPAIDVRMAQQRLELGGEQQQPALIHVIKRLLAEPVTGEEQRLAAAVPQGEGEHPIEAVETAFAPLLPGVDNHLGVRPRAEHMATRGQLGDQGLEVVDLAVEDHADGSVFVEQRLNAAGEIDDGETAMPEANAGSVVKTLPVRPAMANGIGHAAEQSTIDLRVAAPVKNARNSAHSIDPSKPKVQAT